MTVIEEIERLILLKRQAIQLREETIMDLKLEIAQLEKRRDALKADSGAAA